MAAGDPTRGRHRYGTGSMEQAPQSVKTKKGARRPPFHSPARATFEAYRYLYEQFDDAFWTGRILHLQGHITKAEGELPQAESLFRQLVAHYSAHSFEFDLALASLDLSEVLALQGRVLDSGENMEAFYSLLSQWQVNGEILKRWANLKDSLLIRRYKLDAFRELSMVLRRNWNRRQA